MQQLSVVDIWLWYFFKFASVIHTLKFTVSEASVLVSTSEWELGAWENIVHIRD